jgi:outer membrane protein insertion porin family
MKRNVLASNSGSGNVSCGKSIAIAAVTIGLLLFLAGGSYLFGGENFNNYTIGNIFLDFHDRSEPAKNTPYQPLLYIKPGDPFNYPLLRKSMENLYKVGTFDNIEIRVKEKKGKKLDIFFILLNKFTIHAIKIKQAQKTGGIPPFAPPYIFVKRELKNAIYSLQVGAYYEEEKLASVVKEVKLFFNSRGYFKPAVTYEINKDHRHYTAVIKLFIIPGPLALIRKVDLTVNSPPLQDKIERYFQRFHGEPYIPGKIDQTMEKVKKLLRQEKYYFPKITVKEDFPDPSRSSVDVRITINTGARYVFKFKGIKNKMQLISSIWEKKVFEKWAERESKARILYYLKNKGFLNAEVIASVEKKEGVKFITFDVKKRTKYTLGKIYFQGNRSVPETELREITRTDDLLYERWFHLRLDSLLLDQEVIRLYYYSQGFPSARVSAQPTFHDGKADIYFKIEEGKKFTVDTILFAGNRFFTSQALASFIQTRVNGPFVQQTLFKDIEKLKRIYHSHGYDDITIQPEVSPGTEKSILIRVIEGIAYKMGNLITFGVSRQQRKLIQRLFPLNKDDPFDQPQIDVFKNDIENSSLFNRFKIIKIRRESGLVDVLINANPDRSIFYGFGIGWEERKGLRGTLEYQERNVFNSYSVLSGMVQFGESERRGLVSYDTPYFFKTRIKSSAKLWADSEIYPSYEFFRFGISETLIKRLTSSSFLLASLSWYRTKLTDVDFHTLPGSIDEKDDPFDTTALNFSYVREKRDDPFNPTRGSFFSSDLKIGLPLFEKDYSFVKFRWSYQKNFKVLKNGTFAASVRNGLAAGEMSVTERFFAGGIKTFRGVYRDKLGPLDPESSNPTGGNALILFNLETTFPLQVFPINDLYYAFFADIGNVFATVKDFDLSQFQSAIGFSLKYKTRLGPLRFDVAWSLDTGQPKFHIGIGNVF